MADDLTKPYLADIDFAFIAPKTLRVNITVPEYKLVRIDRAAKAKGISRSAFFVDSAEQHIKNMGIANTVRKRQKKSMLPQSAVVNAILSGPL
ncbi:type II toxin-antitoxin system HicB family antitoxin [Desulfobacter latus]|uniref:type II toxin-antitoxin system HicB family antitoxin n=1 Tax=Desulfobacter latus TaxID=2292 RepID=UPI003CCE3DD2